MIFLCLELLLLNTNTKLSNNKTKAILWSRIKGPIARLLLLLLSLKYVKWETLNWAKEFLLLKIPTDSRYYEDLPASLKEGDLAHSWVDIKYTISNTNKTNLNV